MKRPAETAGAGGAIAALICRVAGVKDPDTLTYVAVAVGVIPAAVTLLVARGGVRGVARLMWRGRARR